MIPPTATALRLGRYYRQRWAAIREPVLHAMVSGHDPSRGRLDASSRVERAMRSIIRIHEDHPIDPKFLEDIGGQVDRKNAAAQRVAGIPTVGSGGLTNKNYLVVQNFIERDPKTGKAIPGSSTPTVWRESKSETAAYRFASSPKSRIINRLTKSEIETGGGPLGEAYVIPPGSTTLHPKILAQIQSGKLKASAQSSGSGLLPQGRVNEFRDKNLAYIKKLDSDQISDLRQILEQADREAWRVEQIRAAAVDRLDISARHADLIARDQVLKLNGQLTQDRQVNAGIESYEWSTSGDERVRPGHKELDGTVQMWSAPPLVDDEGTRAHPGEDIQCRCVAIPILS